MITKKGANRGFLFATEAEAKAFVAGVEYVNDSSVEVMDMYLQTSGQWHVSVMDWDKDDD